MLVRSWFDIGTLWKKVYWAWNNLPFRTHLLKLSRFHQQNRFTVIAVLMMTDLILAFAKVGLAYISNIYIRWVISYNFFSFIVENIFFFVRERISFLDQRKYFDSKRLVFETIIVWLLKDYLSGQFWIENPLIMKGIVWESIVCL